VLSHFFLLLLFCLMPPTVRLKLGNCLDMCSTWEVIYNPITTNYLAVQRLETTMPSVNINASYLEALLGKKLIWCKMYFLRTFFIYQPSYIDVFQEICFSCFLDVFCQTLSTPNVIDKDEIYLFIYSSSYSHINI
jgi:hypothetical protein